MFVVLFQISDEKKTPRRIIEHGIGQKTSRDNIEQEISREKSKHTKGTSDKKHTKGNQTGGYNNN